MNTNGVVSVIPMSSVPSFVIVSIVPVRHGDRAVTVTAGALTPPTLLVILNRMFVAECDIALGRRMMRLAPIDAPVERAFHVAALSADHSRAHLAVVRVDGVCELMVCVSWWCV